MKRKKVQKIIIMVVLVIAVSAFFFNYSKYIFRAEEINNGTTKVANLTNNMGDAPIRKYEKFELTFDINRLDKPASDPTAVVINNLNTEIDAGTLNPYWPYDPDPTPNQYFRNNHPNWDIDTSYIAGSNHVQKDGTIYANIKNITVWASGNKYSKDNIVFLAGVPYKDIKDGEHTADSNNQPGTAGGATFWQANPSGVNSSITPGGTGNWQAYWLANPPDPIPAQKGITVNGIFTSSTNETFTQPAYYYQDYEIINSDMDPNHKEDFVPKGDPVWKISFAPREVSNWSYKIQIIDSSGETENTTGAFTSVNSSNKGFPQVSATDNRYFELSDGTPLLGPGDNTGFAVSANSIDTKMKQYGQNGVKLVRFWFDYRGGQSIFGESGQEASWAMISPTSEVGGAKTGEHFSSKINAGGYQYQFVYLTAGIKYHLKGSLKTVGISGGDVFMGAGWYGNWPNAVTLTGDHDWNEYSLDYTPAETRLYIVMINAEAATSGAVYYDNFSLTTVDNDGNPTSRNYLSHGDFDSQNYIDQIGAYKGDLIFQSAKNNGVYLKTLITDKQDMTLSSIGADGNVIARSDNNFYAPSPTGGIDHASRWLQKAWWRYLNARWGSYTSLHSWELCNEGDPFNGNHYQAANAFADYLHGINPKIMATTSFWHSIPMDFWKNSSTDYLDVHNYIGPSYAWQDYPTSQTVTQNDMLPYESTNGLVELDLLNSHSSQQSLKVTAKSTEESGVADYRARMTVPGEFKIGIDPTHTYQISFWYKTQDVGTPPDPNLWWFGPGFALSWSKAYHENDWITGNDYFAEINNDNTWRQYITPVLTPPSDANTANIAINCPEKAGGRGICWFDDFEIIDLNTNEKLFTDGSFEGQRIDDDIALSIAKRGQLYASYSRRVNKPVVGGEMGISGFNLFGQLYNTWQNQLIKNDSEGVFLRKYVWANIIAKSPTPLYWGSGLVSEQNLYKYSKAYQNFMSGVPINNGQYSDAEATTSTQALRAWGQKEVVNDKADRVHLWFDNVPYTWKAVVAHNFDISDSSYAYNPTARYVFNSIAVGNGGDTYYKCVKVDTYPDGSTYNQGHDLSTDYWQEISLVELLKFLSMTSLNPPLPLPISGTVTVPKMQENQNFKLEWWDTSEADPTKQIIKTTYASSDSSGNLVIPVTDLVSDVALKISVSEVVIVKPETPTANSLPHPITYLSTYRITGTKSAAVTQVLANGIEATLDNQNQTWTVDVTLSLGQNTITVIGTDDVGNQSDPASIDLTKRKMADANGDDQIDLIDFGYIMANWGVPPNYLADFNADGKTDLLDFSYLMANWGK